MLWTIGSASSFAKGRQMETKWNMKKESGNFTAGIDPLTGNLIGKTESGQQDQETALKIESLRSKLKSGKKLSVKEKAFLREKAPTLYKKAVEIEQEREEYRKALRRCKTKEDVMRLNNAKTSQLLSAVKAAKGDMDAVETVQMRTAAIHEEHTSFVSSDQYKSLPTEAKQKKKKEKEPHKAVANRSEMPDFLEHGEKEGLPEELADRLDSLLGSRVPEKEDPSSDSTDGPPKDGFGDAPHTYDSFGVKQDPPSESSHSTQCIKKA